MRVKVPKTMEEEEEEEEEVKKEKEEELNREELSLRTVFALPVLEGDKGDRSPATLQIIITKPSMLDGECFVANA